MERHTYQQMNEQSLIYANELKKSNVSLLSHILCCPHKPHKTHHQSIIFCRSAQISSLKMSLSKLYQHYLVRIGAILQKFLFDFPLLSDSVDNYSKYSVKQLLSSIDLSLQPLLKTILKINIMLHLMHNLSLIITSKFISH